jgi:hypothetical protein
MKSWTIKQIADLNIVSESSVKKAIYTLKTLPVYYLEGIKTPRVLHSELVKWLGYDPLIETNGTVEITKTVKTKNRTVTTTTRIQVDEQPSLFDHRK